MSTLIRNTVAVIIILSLFLGCSSKTTSKRNRKRELYSPTQKQTRQCVENICNLTANYPTKHLKKLSLPIDVYDKYAGFVIQPYEDISVNSRLGTGEFNNMCKSIKYMMYPQAARNTKGEWKYIIQRDNFKQIVWFETCLSGNQRGNQNCFASEYIPHDYITSCQQHKVSVKLLVLNGNGTSSVDQFPIPGSCVCSYARLRTLTV